MTSVLVDERISGTCRRALELQGFNVIPLPRHKNLPEAIASHPDTLLFYAYRELFVPAEYCDIAPYVFSEIRELHPNIKINFTDDILGEKYPEDAKMNAKQFGTKLFAKADSLSPAIKDFAKRRGLELVNVNQGYPACTTLALGCAAAISADAGVARVLKDEGIDVTLIQNGDISLPPYEYGFIGGASGVYKNKIFFLGDCKKHRNHVIIEMVIKSNGYTPISLSNEPLCDLGGLVFIE